MEGHQTRRTGHRGLAQPLGRGGSWTRLQQAREQAVLHQARAQLARARLTATTEREQLHRMAKDVDGNPVYLASTRYNLEVTSEKWGRVGFHDSREHGQLFA